MFDLLPEEAAPQAKKLPPELESAQRESIARFKALPASVERNRALSDLGMLGKPSLRKKVSYGFAIIATRLDHRLPELEWVAGIAIQCRNIFRPMSHYTPH